MDPHEDAARMAHVHCLADIRADEERAAWEAEPIGPGEIRGMFGVTAETVSRWQRTGALPPPDYTLAMGPVWRRDTILEWALETGREMEEQ